MTYTWDTGESTDSLADVIRRGSAPDGRLYYIQDIPDISDVLYRQSYPCTSSPGDYRRFVVTVLERLLPEDAPGISWEELVDRSYDFAPSLRSLADGYVLELFHGPSCAFKDFGARFLAGFLQADCERRGEKLVILTATSGDTGSAVGQAFAGSTAVEVVILYPKGRISHLQEKQLTTIGGNVHAIEVIGSFDDCQRMVKESFANQSLRADLSMSSANSINLGRLLPQMLYYLYAAACLAGSGRAAPIFCVPSGNFGNLTAGVMGYRAGMKVSGFIAATNSNDVVPAYLESARFEPRDSIETISNAMDVGNPSNFPRLLRLYNDDYRTMREHLSGYRVSDDQTRESMKACAEDEDYLVCPHTAVGLAATALHRESHTAPATYVTLGTAHPAKFPDIVEQATGRRPDAPERLSRVLDLPGHADTMSSDSRELAAWLREHTLG
ncbi:MAG: threonine synthase [bacterium]